MGAETIYAPATAPGRAAIGVIRVSGSCALEVAHRLAGVARLPPRRACLRWLRDPDSGEKLDRALLLYYPAPASYTGEDMLEIQHHGGPAVLAALLDALGRLPGLRLAEPGEFTRRAFLAGKLDLTEAEAVADLVAATTRAQARLALLQLEGGLRRRCEEWRARILDLLARIEAAIDFGAEEADVPETLEDEVLTDALELRAAIEHHLADDRRGERLRAGLAVAVIGPPNAGKSSLVNLLARREVAIVTPIAGTTRDVLEVALDLGGLPLTLYDTAGLRESADPVEAEGIRRARARAEAADLRLFVLEAGTPAAELPPEDDRTLLVVNKIDLSPPPPLGRPHVAISCVTGAGIAQLVGWLHERAAMLVPSAAEAVITRARHREALMEAAAALRRATESGGTVELAILAEELRLAARAIGRITGHAGVEEVLDRIFATFCIGK